MKWLNGRARQGSRAVLFGPRIMCVGCGKDYDIIGLVTNLDDPPQSMPDFPFDMENCPAHER